ncbi:MAG: monovalent cation/H(+) antiporter subunit G [Deltaproteobacteria bacterium]|nr:MAG: monovalent cation/H(+) antiporter subunit G [Deltaproteobacteria bacterium]
MTTSTGHPILDIIVVALALTGAFFMIVASVGVLRLPDLLLRMHAATKAGALGTGLVLVAVAVYFGEVGMTTRALAGVAFLILTAPVAAHVIGRASYASGVKLWKETRRDELAEYYSTHSPTLVPGSEVRQDPS